jgi:hypothetical protein
MFGEAGTLSHFLSLFVLLCTITTESGLARNATQRRKHYLTCFMSTARLWVTLKSLKVDDLVLD